MKNYLDEINRKPRLKWRNVIATIAILAIGYFVVMGFRCTYYMAKCADYQQTYNIALEANHELKARLIECEKVCRDCAERLPPPINEGAVEYFKENKISGGH